MNDDDSSSSDFTMNILRKTTLHMYTSFFALANDDAEIKQTYMSKQEGNVWLSSIEINFLSRSLPVVLALNLNEIYFIRDNLLINFMKLCVVNSPLGITIRLWCDLEPDGIGALGANSCGASSIKLVVQILSFVAKVPTECRRWWPSDLVSEFWDKLKNLWSLWNVCGLNLMAQFVK